MAPQHAGTVSRRQLIHGSPIEELIAERAVYPLFQPIVDLHTGDVVAVEALARGPAGSVLEFPDALFGAAIDAGLLTELDQLCCARALEIAREAGPLAPPLVFVNAEPAALKRPMSPDLQAVIYGGLPFRIVLEFTERALTNNPSALLRVADHVHRAGNSVALDDVGADPASLAFLPLVEPEVVKLDMHLLRDPYSAGTHATAAAVSGYADRSGATVLAEGVETAEDVGTALALGARWGQGWHFGRPGPLAAIPGYHDAAPAWLRDPVARAPAELDTPFRIASRQHPVRTAGPAMTDALIDHVLTTALDHGRGGIVLCAANGPGHPARWLPRLAAGAGDVTYLGLLSGAPLPESCNVNWELLDIQDPLRAETTIAFLTESTCTALCMRAADGDGCELVHSQDRRTVHPIVHDMIRRFRTW